MTSELKKEMICCYFSSRDTLKHTDVNRDKLIGKFNLRSGEMTQEGHTAHQASWHDIPVTLHKALTLFCRELLTYTVSHMMPYAAAQPEL